MLVGDCRTAFHVDIYRVNVHVVVSSSPTEARNEYPGLISEWPETFVAIADTDGNGNFYVFFGGTVDLATMAHEIFHITAMIMEHIGDEFSFDNHEPWAYLNGYLMEVVHGILSDNEVVE